MTAAGSREANEMPRLRLRKALGKHSILVFLVIGLSSLATRLTGAEDRSAHPLSTYHTASAILTLPPDQINRSYPAKIRGVVTYVLEQGLEIQDATAGLWIYWDKAGDYAEGDELEVEGVISSGLFAPVLNVTSGRKLGRAPLPKPRHTSFNELSSGDMEDQYVTIDGLVRSVSVRNSAPREEKVSTRIKVDGGYVIATFPSGSEATLNRLIDAHVRITATAMCSKNDNGQIIAPILAVSGLHRIQVLKPSPADSFSKPLTPINRLMQYRSGTSPDRRVRVAGTITYYRPGDSLIVEDNGSALSLKTVQDKEIAVGDRLEAFGFLASEASGPALEDAVVKRISPGSPASPTSVTLDEVRSGKLNYTLVTTQGRLLRQMHEPSRDVLVLQDDSGILLAELNSTDDVGTLPKISEGSVVQITGISALEIEGAWNYDAKLIRSKILLRSPDDVQVVGLPGWWTPKHLAYVTLSFGILVLLLLIQMVQSLVERWRLHAVIAERERLAHEIHDTLAQSFAGIGFQLQAIHRAIPQESVHLQQQVNLARELVRHSHKEARRSLEPLHTESFETKDLMSLLEGSARKMVEGGSVEISMSTSGARRPIPVPIADALLKIGYEAIANAVRHADPNQLEIALSYNANAVILSIRDDGAGFVKSGDLLGFGLRGMRKRAAAISADLEIQSKQGSGTCILVAVPLVPVRTPFGILRFFWSYLSERVSHVYSES